ncbi:MAG: two-component system response regulator RppA [Cyanobacteria bacterium P01_A01_bin.135]
MRILLVDDEAELADALGQVLQREGYQVTLAYDGERGAQLAQDEAYDLLILDWMLPGQSGLAVCQEIRSRGQVTPVLFLTAKDTVDDRVDGLDAGADDYLVKPFELKELLARVRALLRRPPSLLGDASDRLTLGELTLDPANQIASVGDRTVELSEKESRLLAYFIQYPDQLLSHRAIYQQVWPEDPPTSNALAAQVRLLRRKLDALGESSIIHTVYGKGYRFGRPN